MQLSKRRYKAGIESLHRSDTFPQNPKSPERILADADLYHFTKTDYPKYERRLKWSSKPI